MYLLHSKEVLAMMTKDELIDCCEALQWNWKSERERADKCAEYTDRVLRREKRYEEKIDRLEREKYLMAKELNILKGE